jgi:hypothetical protein
VSWLLAFAPPRKGQLLKKTIKKRKKHVKIAKSRPAKVQKTYLITIISGVPQRLSGTTVTVTSAFQHRPLLVIP